MAHKAQAEIQERFKQLLRYAIRIVPVVIVVAAIAWFFLLRPSGDQTNTAGSGKDPETTENAPETTVSTTTPSTKPEAKVPDNAALAEAVKDDGKGKKGELPETGPTDTLAIFAITTAAGTLFWEWRSRRTRSS